MNIQPLPSNLGYGFTSYQPLDVAEYDYKQYNIHHNYYFNDQQYNWPESSENYIISDKKADIFSPNLNKHLHVGHLKNLLVGASLTKICQFQPISLLGASLGVYSYAEDEVKYWFKKVGLENVKIYYDVLLPIDIPHDFEDGQSQNKGCKIWNGPNGKVIVEKSTGEKTYAFHDLAFAHWVAPDYYVVGVEQKDHFNNLGLGDKHIGVGLVVDENGHKLKSRDGSAILIDDIIKMVANKLEQTDNPSDLAYNIVGCQLLSVKSEKNIKFILEDWLNPNNYGLYINYSYARFCSALQKCKSSNWEIDSLDNFDELEKELIYMNNYFEYYKIQCIKHKSPHYLLHYLFELSKKANQVYEQNRIVEGDFSTQAAMYTTLETMKDAMNLLCLETIEKI